MFQEVGMDEKLSFPENVVFREEPEGGILFNVDTGDMRIVEDVAWGICTLLESGSTRSEIVAVLHEMYGEEESVESDLDDFLGELEKAGMLEAANGQ
jgi:hypothetical protein